MGALAGMGAATVCHPLDVIRVHMQIPSGAGSAKEGVVSVVKNIVLKDGIKRGLYAGLSAAYLRQWTYGSCRMGIYSYLMTTSSRDPVTFTDKLGMGMIAGASGSIFGTPSEVALVRMSADSKLPLASRRGYTGIFDCILRISREEGVTALWTGVGPTAMRATLMGACQMGVYSQTKQMLLSQYPNIDSNGIPLMFASALSASFVANSVTMPLDVVKSRIQNMPSSSTPLYSGMVDCVTKSVRSEGVFVLWKGFTPAFLKLAPYTVISLTLLEKISTIVTGSSAL